MIDNKSFIDGRFAMLALPRWIIEEKKKKKKKEEDDARRRREEDR